MANLPNYIGRYEILGPLGSGGMAEILLGRLRGPGRFERPVVIKRILPHLAHEKRFLNMFRDEAQIVAGIRHQNVVHVQEFGEEDNQLFLVLEYLEGENTSSLARRLSSHRKLLKFGLCAYLVAEAAAGLHAAHEITDVYGVPKGLVHRDVSPANVFVTYSGEVKVLDFGIAITEDRDTKTDVGQVKGKYAYMSPEQCMGKDLDRRSDIFSLGIVLYELSTCRRLFKRKSDLYTLQAICNENAPSPQKIVPEYPPALARICLKALSKSPRDRYATALDMRRDLLAVANQLNGDKLPEVSLGKVMRRLFEDRLKEKRQMLVRLQEGKIVDDIPSNEEASFNDEGDASPAAEISSSHLDAVPSPAVLPNPSGLTSGPPESTSELGSPQTFNTIETTPSPQIKAQLIQDEAVTVHGPNTDVNPSYSRLPSEPTAQEARLFEPMALTSFPKHLAMTGPIPPPAPRGESNSYAVTHPIEEEELSVVLMHPYRKFSAWMGMTGVLLLVALIGAWSFFF